MAGPDFPEFEPALTKQHQQLAKELLKVREARLGFLWFFRLYAVGLLFRYIPVIPLVLVLYNYGKDKSSIALLLILVAWIFYFDIKSIRSEANSWGLYRQMMDWDKIAKLAEGSGMGKMQGAAARDLQ
jgi:hypothetical protein